MDELIELVRELQLKYDAAFADGFAAGKVAERKSAEEYLVGGTTKSRLARLLLRYPVAARMTHEALANRVGCSRETITRVLRQMKDQGMLSPNCRVVDRAALEEWADRGYLPYRTVVDEGATESKTGAKYNGDYRARCRTGGV